MCQPLPEMSSILRVWRDGTAAGSCGIDNVGNHNSAGFLHKTPQSVHSLHWLHSYSFPSPSPSHSSPPPTPRSSHSAHPIRVVLWRRGEGKGKDLLGKLGLIPAGSSWTRHSFAAFPRLCFGRSLASTWSHSQEDFWTHMCFFNSENGVRTAVKCTDLLHILSTLNIDTPTFFENS